MKVKISRQPEGDLATKYPFALPNETVEIADENDARALIDGGFGKDPTGQYAAKSGVAKDQETK